MLRKSSFCVCASVALAIAVLGGAMVAAAVREAKTGKKATGQVMGVHIIDAKGPALR